MIDDIDQISRNSDHPSVHRDVSGVQQARLKIIEVSVVNGPTKVVRKHPYKKMISIKTHNLLFIAVGAFNVLENFIKKRLNNRFSYIGYNDGIQPSHFYGFDVLQYTTPADLRDFGLIP